MVQAGTEQRILLLVKSVGKQNTYFHFVQLNVLKPGGQKMRAVHWKLMGKT